MKTEIHPEYVPAHVRCTCGNEFWTRSTKPELHVEICSNCHPFYTGRQKLVDTGGRVERFRRRAARAGELTNCATQAPPTWPEAPELRSWSAAGARAARRRKRSTRPPVSTSFWRPV